MSDDPPRPASLLSRWSARKHAAVRAARAAVTPTAQGGAVPDAGVAPPAGSAARVATVAPVASVAAAAAADPATPIAVAGTAPATLPPAARADATPVEPPPLPPVESLTPASDFTPFMRAGVDPAVRGAALRKLFADPHFNAMDGLDVYIDDYTKPDPIEPSVVARLRHARFLFSPPPTRVNAQGFVEDLPPEELAATEPATEAAAETPYPSVEPLAARSPDAGSEPAAGGDAQAAVVAAATESDAAALSPAPPPQLELPLAPAAPRKAT